MGSSALRVLVDSVLLGLCLVALAPVPLHAEQTAAFNIVPTLDTEVELTTIGTADDPVVATASAWRKKRHAERRARAEADISHHAFNALRPDPGHHRGRFDASAYDGLTYEQVREREGWPVRKEKKEGAELGEDEEEDSSLLSPVQFLETPQEFDAWIERETAPLRRGTPGSFGKICFVRIRDSSSASYSLRAAGRRQTVAWINATRSYLRPHDRASHRDLAFAEVDLAAWQEDHEAAAWSHAEPQQWSRDVQALGGCLVRFYERDHAHGHALYDHGTGSQSGRLQHLGRVPAARASCEELSDPVRERQTVNF
eukprot:COSAG01_NODE_15068_length_1378_cov_1.847537_1_plen_313_part_00